MRSSPFKHLTKEDLERIRTCLFREIGEYLSHDCEAAAVRCIDTVRNLEREIELIEHYRRREEEWREANQITLRNLSKPLPFWRNAIIPAQGVFREDSDE